MRQQKNFNNCKSNFDTHDIYQLVSLIGRRCSLRTKQRLTSVLTYDAMKLPCYGIFERLMFEQYEWSYCAGQDYTAEIKTIRNIILRGK